MGQNVRYTYRLNYIRPIDGSSFVEFDLIIFRTNLFPPQLKGKTRCLFRKTNKVVEMRYTYYKTAFPSGKTVPLKAGFKFYAIHRNHSSKSVVAQTNFRYVFLAPWTRRPSANVSNSNSVTLLQTVKVQSLLGVTSLPWSLQREAASKQLVKVSLVISE